MEQVQELAEALQIQFAETDEIAAKGQCTSRVNAEISQEAVRGVVNAPEEMVGPFEAITSEPWIHMLRVGSVCLRPHQTKQGPRCDWRSRGGLARRRRCSV